jgi:16S rRNA (cytidine1402-2'-O)-methyltransferase
MKESTPITGILYLLPVGLGENNHNKFLPEYNIQITSSLKEFIVENVRTARRFLRSTGYVQDFENVIFHVLDKHTSDADIPGFLHNLKNGQNIGLLSEAGNPCIADPGNKVVKLAHASGIRVRPLVGPSSILMALIASGFNGQNFAFCGYLPMDKQERQAKIKELQHLAVNKNQTQIFMETPFRNNSLLADVLNTCHETMLLCIATNISTDSESIITKSVKEWKKQTPDLHKQPSVYLLYKND